MRISSLLTHDPSDRHVPRGILVPVVRPSHRPQACFRLRIRSGSDAADARRIGLPLHFVGPEVTAAWGFPSAFAGVLVASKSLTGLIDSPLRIVTFESEEAARQPGLEDLVIVLLHADPLLARALAMHHRGMLNPDRLLKRLLQENLEETATKMGLQAIVPSLPRVGLSLPEALLKRQDQQAWVEGRL